MRTPNLNVGSRVPSINAVAPRTTPNIAARPNVGVDTVARTRPDLGARSTLSVARFPTNSSSACQNAGRGADGECLVTSAGGGKGGSAKNVARKGKGGADKGNSQAALNLRTVPNELVAEIDGALSTAEADELARRHGLERIASQNFPLLGGTIGLFRIVDRRPVDTVRREFAADGSVRSVQFNFRYFLQDQKKARDRGRRRAICGRPAPAAAGPCARPRHERHHRGDRFRRRRQTSRTRQFGRRQFRCARQQAKVRMSTAPASPARSSRMPG